MDEENGFNRRKFLKKSSAVGGATTFGLVDSVSASQVTAPDVDKLTTTKRVQSIKDALPRLQLQTKRAEAVEFSGNDGVFLTLVEIPANFGKLHIGELNGTDYREVIFDFDGHRPIFDQDWPTTADAVLIGQEDEAVLFRTPSDQELQGILGAVGKETSDVKIYTHSAQEGFTVVDSRADQNKAEVLRVKNDGTAGTMATANSEYQVSNRRTIDLEEARGQVSVSADCSDSEFFALQGYLCAQNIGACVLCGSLCASSLLGNVAGVVACFTCLGLTCGLTSLPKVESCNFVAKCIGEYTDDVSF